MFQINPPKFPYKSRNISILGWSYYVLPRFHHLFKSYLITPWSNGARAVSDMPAGPQAWAWAWLKLGPQGRLRKILCVCAPFKKDTPSSHPGTGEKIKLYIYIIIYIMDFLLSVAMKVGLSENTTRHGESPRNISTNCDCGQIIMARAQHHSWNQQPNSPARCPSVSKMRLSENWVPPNPLVYHHVPYWTCHQLEVTFPFSDTSIHHIVEISPSKCPHLYPFIADVHWFSHSLPV